MLFIGKYDHTLDEKGRVALPAQHRRQLVGPLYLTFDLTINKSLALFTESAFQAESEKLLSKDSSDEFVQQQIDWFVGNAREVVPNTSGRIQVPKEHRDALGMKEGDQVVVTGLGNRVVIRARGEYDQSAPQGPPKKVGGP